MTEFQEAVPILFLAADLSSVLILAYKSCPLINTESFWEEKRRKKKKSLSGPFDL